jgi:uncharacterized protein
MNRQIFKKIFALTMLIVMIICCTSQYVHATNLPSKNGNQTTITIGKSHIYIHDLANLMTSQEENDLVESIRDKCEQTEYNVLFLTTNETNGKSTMVYSDDYMDALFPVGTENNIAFIIDMDNREIYINTMGEAIRQISDNEIDKALDRGYSKIQEKDYSGCMQAMATYCLSDLQGTDQGENAFVDSAMSALPGSLLVTAIVVIILVVKHNKANKSVAATSYLNNGDYDVICKDETFVRSYETVQHDYYKPKSSSGGSSHSSSSGRSHGGGGRKF